MRDSRTDMPTTSVALTVDGGEIMWGRLVIVGKPGKPDQRVLVKVYRTSLEHFAIVYPDKTVANPCGCLNLKHSRVETLDNCECSFRVVQKSCDAPNILFKAESEEKRNVWLSAMYSENSCGQGISAVSLPVLVEEEEE